MKVNMKYFGMVAELAGSAEEMMEIDVNAHSNALIDLLNDKYQALNHINYRLAVNENLISENIQLREYDTIAVLPPFSGG